MPILLVIIALVLHLLLGWPLWVSVLVVGERLKVRRAVEACSWCENAVVDGPVAYTGFLLQIRSTIKSGVEFANALWAGI